MFWGSLDKAFQIILEIRDGIVTLLGNTGPGSRLIFRIQGNGDVERGVAHGFTIVLEDALTGAILTAKLDISAISVTMLKSTGPTFVAASSAPVFTVADGNVRSVFQFLDAEWGDGSDSYDLAVSGITADIDGTIVPVPACFWSGRVAEAGDLKAKLDTLATEATTGFGILEGIALASKVILDKFNLWPESKTLSNRTLINITTDQEITLANKHTATRNQRVQVDVRAKGLVFAAALYTIQVTVVRGLDTFYKGRSILFKEVGITAIEFPSVPFPLESGDQLCIFIKSSAAGDISVEIESEVKEIQ